MKNVQDGVTVTIMGKEFMVACPEGERDALAAAASFLDRKMREIQDSGKVIGTERCAIMAALNIANDLLDLRKQGNITPDVNQKLRFLQTKIDAALRHEA
ncbi:MAG: cell division protein ZapA [Acidiferrobacterales bacterium]|nr:cell division protein ZapA [Gammaproteobacteria bacterium]